MAYYDDLAATLDPGVLTRRDVFERELATIYARSWIFVGPESWVDAPGDYYRTQLGTEPKLLWRAADGRLNLRSDRCLRGGGPLGSVDAGSAVALPCRCHGWLHGPEDEIGEVGLRLEAYRGLVFATGDQKALPLAEWLAPFRYWLDLVLGQAGIVETAEFYRGWTSWLVAANWKLGARAYCGDVDSFSAAGLATPSSALQSLTDVGVCIVSREDCEAGGRGPFPLTGTLFPNLSFDTRIGALIVWHPIAADRTMARSYLLPGPPQSPEDPLTRRRAWTSLLGPAGLLSARQAAIWSSIMRAAGGVIAQRNRLALTIGLGEERQSNLPGRQAELRSDAGERAFYSWWQDRLDAPPAGQGQSPAYPRAEHEPG